MMSSAIFALAIFLYLILNLRNINHSGSETDQTSTQAKYQAVRASYPNRGVSSAASS